MPDPVKKLTWGTSEILLGKISAVNPSNAPNRDSVTVEITQPFTFDVPKSNNLTKEMKVEVRLQIFGIDEPSA
jgi:hypothetical protein